MKNRSYSDEYYDLFLLLQQTSNLVLKVRQTELKEFDITTAQAVTLLAIQALGSKATPTEISRWVFRRPHSVSEILDRMEREGLVKKVKSSGLRVRTTVVLTEKGQEAYDKSTERQRIVEIMSSLSEEERRRLRSNLETLRDEALKHVARDLTPPFP